VGVAILATFRDDPDGGCERISADLLGNLVAQTADCAMPNWMFCIGSLAQLNGPANARICR